MERQANSHNGRVDCQDDGVGRDGEIDCFIKERNLSSFVSTRKSLLDFLFKRTCNVVKCKAKG